MGERTHMKALLPLALVAAVAGAGIAVGGVALVGATGAAPTSATQYTLDAAPIAASPGATITVTGSGTVEGTPDTVSLQIGVHTTASSATAALSENNARMTALQASLTQHGVASAGMQTSNLDLYVNTDSADNVTSFSCDDELDVTMHDLSQAGGAIDAAANAVGNGVQLYGVSFSISNTSGLLATARARAMQNAATEAVQLANGAGEHLGGIVRVTDQENQQPPIYQGFAAAAIPAGVPLQTGHQPLSVQVTVVYALRS